jgi:hypothetical protein
VVVIGAGFGRTGTTSLKRAIEILGLGPCYHMQIAMTRPGHARFWLRAKSGSVSAAEWRKFFRNYGATVDWPACEFYRELMVAFPSAKILLNVRDPESWYDSTHSTLYAVKDALPTWFPASVLRMQDALIWRGRFKGQFADRASAIAEYRAHIAEVREFVPADRLLEYRVEQGWEPLCDFLKRPVPVSIEFPRVNDRRYFQRVLTLFRIANWLAPIIALVAILGTCLFFA